MHELIPNVLETARHSQTASNRRHKGPQVAILIAIRGLILHCGILQGLLADRQDNPLQRFGGQEEAAPRPSQLRCNYSCV